MANIQNFIANTDYPFDMIVYFKRFEFTTTGGYTTQTISFSHGLEFTPLCFGVWSDVEDFAHAWTLERQGYGVGQTAVWVEADGDNIYVNKNNNNEAGRKIYLKIYGFAPTTWTGDCEPTATTSDFLLMNTDYEYSPLLAAGAVQLRRMDAQEPTPSEINGITLELAKDGYLEASGRAISVIAYYPISLSPMAMTWKTTASTGRTEYVMNCQMLSMGFSTSQPPSVVYTTNSTIQGQNIMTINIGSTRSGLATYDDVIHFRVYA